MTRFNRILTRLLFPGTVLAALSVPIAAALLIYVFSSPDVSAPLAYAAYAVSAYSLTVVCAWLWRNARRARERVETAIHESALADRYFTDTAYRLQLSLYVSFALNAAYALMKAALGIYYRSAWFGTLAAYYFVLAVMRFCLLRRAGRAGFGSDLRAEWRQYIFCGCMLLVMNAVLTGVVILVTRGGAGFEYPGYLIYIMAMYAFYNIAAAVRNVIKFRRYKSPAMAAAKVISLAAALVSMLALETAMLAQFGADSSVRFRELMTGCTGGAVCAGIFGIAAYMVCRAAKMLGNTETEEAS